MTNTTFKLRVYLPHPQGHGLWATNTVKTIKAKDLETAQRKVLRNSPDGAVAVED